MVELHFENEALKRFMRDATAAFNAHDLDGWISFNTR